MTSDFTNLRAQRPRAAFRHLRERPPVSRAAYYLFLAVAAYLVIPVLEIPLWGLSLSTPIFCFITLDLLERQSRIDWSRCTKWIFLALAFWAGQFLSVSGNVFAGNITALGLRDAVWLIRFAYWIVVFGVTTAVISRIDAGPRIARVLGISVLALATLRLFESLVLGTWGAGKASLSAQNSYGWLFSTFTPFAVWLALSTTGWKRSLSCGGLVLLVVAIAGNGSRSSWITVTLGIVLMGLLLKVSQARFLFRLRYSLFLLAILSAAVMWTAPAGMWSAVQKRLSTFERLEKDKPYVMRQVLIQKGLLLFRENPLWGIGVGRFTHTSVPLEIPRVFRNKPQEHFHSRSAHNSYIALLAETGLAGTIPFAILLLVLVAGGLRATLHHSRRGDCWAVPIYVGFVCMSIHFWALSGLTNTSTWFMYGLVAGIIQREPKSQSKIL